MIGASLVCAEILSNLRYAAYFSVWPFQWSHQQCLRTMRPFYTTVLQFIQAVSLQERPCKAQCLIGTFILQVLLTWPFQLKIARLVPVQVECIVQMTRRLPLK